MDAHDRQLTERLAKIDAAIRTLADEILRLERTLVAERSITTRALAASMVRIENLERQ